MVRPTALLALILPLAAAAAGFPDEVAAGAKLAAPDAAALETRFASGKAAAADRARLLGWYSTHPESRDRRIALILAMVEKGDSAQLFEHGAARVGREDEAYAKVKAALSARAEKSHAPADRSNLVWFLFAEEPDKAFELAAANGQIRDSAVLAAHYLLGLGPIRINPDARRSGFGRGLLELVNETADPLFQFAFGDALRQMGAWLYASGQIEWDYTTLANAALARASKAEPQQTNCGFDPAVLPARGGVATLPKLSSAPVGGVSFHALIGCSGYVTSLEWLDGPAASAGAAKREIAARNFEVPRVNGQPRQILAVVTTTAGRRAP